MMYRFKTKTGAYRNWPLLFSTARCFATLFFLLVGSLASAGSIQLTLTDALTQNTINNQRVDAWLIDSSGKKHWKAKSTSNDAGLASFELDDLPPGAVYKFYARVFSKFRSELVVQQSSANQIWPIGSFKARIINGTVASDTSNGQAVLSNTNVYIQYRTDNGKFKWFASIQSDENGDIRADLPGLGNGTVYRLYARSPANGQTKYSDPLDDTSPYTFTVGNLPLTVMVTDNETGQPVPNTKITAYERLSDGSSKWAASLKTNESGIVVFDLDGLGKKRSYYLKAKVFNQFTAHSARISSPQNYHWKLGSFIIHVLNGNHSPASPLQNQEIYIEHLKENGKFGWFGKATTDDQGKLKLDLPETANGQVYRLRAKSPLDGSYKYSAEIKQPGTWNFKVGNLPLLVKLSDQATGNALEGIDVTVYELLENGEKTWRTHKSTDANGSLAFDLDGLGSGRRYFLKARVYNRNYVESKVLTTTEPFEWKFGKVQISVLNGNIQPPAPIGNYEIIIEKKKSNGKFRSHTKAVSDATGMVKIDLPGLGEGSVYRFKGKSLADGRYKTSDEISSNGHHDFVIGNLPLLVTFTNDEGGKALSGLDVTAFELLADGSKKRVTQKTTDSNGLLTMDLDGLDSGRKYILKTRAFNDFEYRSAPFSSPGKYTIRLGTVRAQVMDGSKQPPTPLVETKIYIDKLEKEGKYKRFGRAYTDDAGMLRIDLPGVESGTLYRLSAPSPSSGETKYSDPIANPGNHSFVVGNPAVNVTLINAMSGQRIPNKKLAVYRVNDDGSHSRVTGKKTDSNGRAVFDLDNVGENTNYFLKAHPFNGGYTHSDPITHYGNFDFRVGTVPVTLVNSENDNPIPNKKVTAFAIKPDGSLEWRKSAKTDSQGQIIFDLEGLRDGTRFILKASHPFGRRGYYYSGVIQSEGAFLFAVTEGETGQPDTEFPELTITSPASGSSVPARGFIVTGTAADNRRIDRIVASIRSGEMDAVTSTAEYNATTGEWSLTVSADQLVPEQSTVISVTAFDGSDNATVQEISLLVEAAITDSAPPVINLLSHSDGSDVPKTGVILQGTVTDDAGLSSLVATVTDPVLGTVISEQPIQFNINTGQWELVIRNGQMTVNRSIALQLVATDAANNTTILNATFNVVPVDHESMQILNRLTFGITPQLKNQMAMMGSDAFLQQFLQQQLNPATIDDTVFDLFIAGFQPASQDDLKFWALQHMLFSEKQLQEVMTWFWDNHFNTDVDSHEMIAYEVNENNGFRQHALGYFRDLLEVSAKSPAMLVYLNNAESVEGAPNENYARELMELHTLGVDGGYTATDIAELARVFTGWQVQNGQFFFNSSQHDFGTKTVLGETIQGTGLSEGEHMLTVLSTHPSTATFICGKLVEMLVSESPSSATLNTCTSTFQSSGGHIGTVVEALTSTPEFNAETTFRNKVKTPLEMLTSVIRNFTANFSQYRMHLALRRMGMDLFDNSVPTGWSERSEDWINSNLLLQRTRFVNQVAFNSNPDSGNYIDVMTLVQNAGVTSPEAIVALFFDIALGGDYNETEYQIGLDILNDNGNNFDINDPQAEMLLRRLLGHVMSFPGYQFQ